MTSTIQTLLATVERLGAQIDWAEVESYAHQRQHSLTAEQRREQRIREDDERMEKRRTRKMRAAQRELARVDSALAELE